MPGDYQREHYEIANAEGEARVRVIAGSVLCMCVCVGDTTKREAKPARKLVAPLKIHTTTYSRCLACATSRIIVGSDVADSAEFIFCNVSDIINISIRMCTLKMS